MLKEQESGRSMIEMLGVLAIIGVLSVGGIAGYTSAMNKHRANELLHQVSMRAATCVAQLASGNTSLSVADFGDYDGYSFTAAPNPSNANQFTITITAPTGNPVSKTICNNMKNTVGVNVKKFDPATCGDSNATIVLTYNNDMSDTVYASDFNGDQSACVADSSRQYCAGNDTCVSATDTCPSTVVCSGHGYKDSNDDCLCDPGYSGTDCATAACTTGTYCGSGATKECCAEDEVCTTSGDVAGMCVKNTGGCTTNASCNDATKYCKLMGNWKDGSPTITGGTCETLDAGRETAYTDSTDTAKTKTFLVSSSSMSWWAADNWCKAHGKKLVSYNTVKGLFDCVKNSTRSCTWSKFTTSDYWSNGTLPDHYWISESKDSRYAHVVYVSDDYFNYNARSNVYSALCE